MMSSACTWGHGTQLRQPVSCFAAPHTPRSPRIANGRFNSAETFWLMVGLSRFQSKVAIKMIATTINNRKPLKSQPVILPALPHRSLPHILPVPVLKIVQPRGKWAARRTAVFSVSIGAGRERNQPYCGECGRVLNITPLFWCFYALDNHPRQ